MASTASPELSARERIVAEDVASVLAAPLPWRELDGAEVLITGAGGFLAGYLVEVLMTMRPLLGFGPKTVAGLVRNPARAHARFAHYAGRPELKLFEGDVKDGVSGLAPQFIVHAASYASPRYYLTDPVGILEANLAGTAAMLELARETQGKLLFFSTSEVYGQTDKVPTAEGDYGYLDPTAIRSCYAESKRAAETMCACWAHQHGVHATIVRPFHTYGPTVALDDGRVFADFVSDVLAGRDIVMKSEGLATRAFCYVADATAGFFTVLLKGESGQAYNVGNDRAEISIRGLADTLAGLFPERGLKVITDPTAKSGAYAASPVMRNAPDIERARALGWAPQTPLEQGFRRMVLSYL
ncbi:MAG: NAD-dependent epimerase/dehydratase family protein [Novosphingobium sp.]